MKKEIANWSKLCEGKIDKLDFNPTLLFMDFNNNSQSYSDMDLDEIFKYFDKSNQLKERFSNYIYDNSIVFKSEAYFKEKACLDIIEKKNILNKSHNYSDYLSHAKVEYITNIEKIAVSLKENIIRSEIKTIINDYFIDFELENVKNNFYLYDALYGLVGDTYLVWYLISPILKTQTDCFNNYCLFTKMGGKYFFSDTTIFIYK